MKKMIFILCMLIAFMTTAHAERMYNCVDRDGNRVITDKPQEDMTNCVLEGSDEDSSIRKGDAPQNEKGKGNKISVNSQCGLVASNMNDARVYLNQAAGRKTSEIEEGREDVKKSIEFLMEAQRSSAHCPCASLGDEIYYAIQLAQQAVSENSISRFSDLLTRAILAFNKSQEAFENCK